MLDAGTEEADVDQEDMGGAETRHDRLRQMDALDTSSAGQHPLEPAAMVAANREIFGGPA